LKSSRVKNIIDAEVAWKMFLEERGVSSEAQSQIGARYIRLNPKMDSVPDLDDTKFVENPQWITFSGISEETVRNLALQLIASTFYFNKTTYTPRHNGTNYEYHGKLDVCVFDVFQYLTSIRTYSLSI
jgi:hypothetical protein